MRVTVAEHVPASRGLRALMERWDAVRRSAVAEQQRKGALSEAIPQLADALSSALAGAPRPSALRAQLAVYSPDEVMHELALLRDYLLAALPRSSVDATREGIWRFFDAEIFAVVRAAAMTQVRPSVDAAAAAARREAKDTETLPADRSNPIADAFHAEGGARLRRRVARDRALLLAEVSKALSRSIRFDDALDEIARIALRAFADWTIVDALDGSGHVHRCVRHRDPGRSALAAELEADYVPRDASRGVPSHVLRTRESLLIPRVTDEHYRTTTRSPRHEQILRALGSASYMAVPMVVRDRTLGVITFVSSDPNDLYDRDDVIFAEEIGSRAALALENCVLYQRSLDAVRVRDDFLSIVSHDLKSPLQVVDMCAQLLERGAQERSLDERGARLVRQIRSSSQRMRRLINDLLDLSRIEAGRLELVRAPEPLDALLRDLVQQFEPLAASKAQRLELEPPAPGVSLYCERERVFQALANLVSNAVKFTPEGGLIAIRAVDEGAQVCVEVRDTGPGIAPEHVAHLFDRYWQANDTARNGTGLGLSIARAMIEAHRGSIDVESALGRGTCFRVHLPKQPPPPGADA